METDRPSAQKVGPDLESCLVAFGFTAALPSRYGWPVVIRTARIQLVLKSYRSARSPIISVLKTSQPVSGLAPVVAILVIFSIDFSSSVCTLRTPGFDKRTEQEDTPSRSSKCQRRRSVVSRTGSLIRVVPWEVKYRGWESLDCCFQQEEALRPVQKLPIRLRALAYQPALSGHRDMKRSTRNLRLRWDAP